MGDISKNNTTQKVMMMSNASCCALPMMVSSINILQLLAGSQQVVANLSANIVIVECNSETLYCWPCLVMCEISIFSSDSTNFHKLF